MMLCISVIVPRYMPSNKPVGRGAGADVKFAVGVII
jgi:hypothetical protein